MSLLALPRTSRKFPERVGNNRSSHQTALYLLTVQNMTGIAAPTPKICRLQPESHLSIGAKRGFQKTACELGNSVRFRFAVTRHIQSLNVVAFQPITEFLYPGVVGLQIDCSSEGDQEKRFL